MIPGLSSAPPTIAICGDPVVARALAELLQDHCYSTKFMPISSLHETGALEGVGLLLLTCTMGLSPGHRDAVPASVEDRGAVADIPVLKLVAFSGKMRAQPRNAVPWPCSTAELKRRIEEALDAGPGAYGQGRRRTKSCASPREPPARGR